MATAKSRRQHFFALPGRYRSLQLVPAEVFQELLDQVRKVSFANQKMTLALGKIGSMGHECRCDKQGRIRLTARLAEHAGIDDRAVLVGAITTIQIWNPEAWENHRVDSETGLDAVQAIQENRTDLGTIRDNLTGGSRQ